MKRGGEGELREVCRLSEGEKCRYEEREREE